MISEKVRERAAQMLAMCASSRAIEQRGVVDTRPGCGLYDYGDEDEAFQNEAASLARAAFLSTPMDYRDTGGGEIPWEEQWAEAEAWIRTGWTP